MSNRIRQNCSRVFFIVNRGGCLDDDKISVGEAMEGLTMLAPELGQNQMNLYYLEHVSSFF